jgi:hypothetical protein
VSPTEKQLVPLRGGAEVRYRNASEENVDLHVVFIARRATINGYRPEEAAHKSAHTASFTSRAGQ